MADFSREFLCTIVLFHFLNSSLFGQFYKELAETARARDEKASGTILVKEAVGEQSSETVGRLMALLPQRKYD